MYRNNKGSALIIVLLIMTFVTVLAASVINITRSEDTMSKMYNDKNSAYYVAEAGVEKSVSILKSALNNHVNSSSFQNSIINSGVNSSNIKSKIQSYLSGYYATLRDNTGDGVSLLNSAGSTKRYFDVNASSPATAVTETGTGKFNCIINIPITSKGYDGSIMSTIETEQAVEFTIDISDQTGGGSTGDDYPDAGIFLQNMINVIDDPTNTSDVIFNGTYHNIGGNILVSTNNSVRFTGSFSLNGNTAIRSGKDIIFSGSTVIQDGRNLILDANNVSGSFSVNSSDLFTRQKNNIQDSKNRTWNSTFSSTVSMLLTPSYNNVSDAFYIKELKPSIGEGNFRGMKYYSFYDKNHDISEDRYIGTYPIILCNDGAVINGSFNYNGLIYCNGPLKINGAANIQGIIIAKSIDVFGTLTGSYDIPTPSNEKYIDIKDFLVDSTIESPTPPTMSVGGLSWKAVKWNVK